MHDIKELNREFSTLHRPLRDRTYAETHDPVEPGQVGPNGGRVGYLKGDKVEWLVDEDEPGEELALILRRSDAAILTMYKELWDKVWYNRQQVRLQKFESGELKPTAMDMQLMKSNKKVFAQLEEKYGRENLIWDEFEWGLLSGRMSALAWVMGSDWEGSLDT